MATRRLVGADKRGIFLKVITESTVLCGISMVLAILLAEALSPAVSRMLEYPVSVFKAITPGNVLLAVAFVIVLGVLAGIVPALLIQRAQPIEIVRGTLRLKTKTVYSKVIIIVQNVVTVVMLVCAFTMWLQIRHMVPRMSWWSAMNSGSPPPSGRWWTVSRRNPASRKWDRATAFRSWEPTI